MGKNASLHIQISGNVLAYAIIVVDSLLWCWAANNTLAVASRGSQRMLLWLFVTTKSKNHRTGIQPIKSSMLELFSSSLQVSIEPYFDFIDALTM
jgi:hypothetical protein